MLKTFKIFTYNNFCLVHPIFRFWSLLVTKLWKYKNICLYFARQDWQDGKKWKENHATKVTKIPKLYIPSTPNNSNGTHTFMCLGRTGRFGQH